MPEKTGIGVRYSSRRHSPGSEQGFRKRAFTEKLMRSILKNTGILIHRQRKGMTESRERRKEIVEIKMSQTSVEGSIFSVGGFVPLEYLG